MIIVATQGHDDEDVLERAVASGPAYLGLVGSRRRGASVLGYLADRGVPQDRLDRVRVPAGLDLGGKKYKGKVAVRMGPVRLQFAGTADITERDDAAKRVVVHANGADEKGRGQASMIVTATLTRAGQGTKVGV